MNTRFVILLGLVSLAVADSPPKNASGCHICLNGICYVKTKLLSYDYMPYILNYAVDRSRNILYSTDRSNAVYTLNLEDKTVKKIRNNGNERSLAVDQNTGDLYIAAGTDIIKYSPVTNKTDRIQTPVNVKKLRFKDKLYVLGYTSVTRLYTLEESGLVMITHIKENFIVDFVVDKLGDIYYSQRVHENFKFSAGDFNVTMVIGDKKVAYATDNDDEVYFIGAIDKSIFKLDYRFNQFAQVGAFDVTTFYNVPISAQFDKNKNVVFVEYSTMTERNILYYLMANTQRCMTNESLKVDEEMDRKSLDLP